MTDCIVISFLLPIIGNIYMMENCVMECSANFFSKLPGYLSYLPVTHVLSVRGLILLKSYILALDHTLVSDIQMGPACCLSMTSRTLRNQASGWVRLIVEVKTCDHSFSSFTLWSKHFLLLIRPLPYDKLLYLNVWTYCWTNERTICSWF